MAEQKKSVGSPLWNSIKPFAFGGISGMTATVIIQPIDMVKVRIQLQSGAGSSNPIKIASEVLKKEGFFAFYKGLSAGLLRQATYTTARMGLFNSFIDSIKASKKGGEITYAERAIAGLAAGGLGSMVGNPADLSLIRMQADGTLPVDQRRNYKNVFDALARIVKEEGVLALWKGATPTVVRAMALNLGMLASYSEAQAQLDKRFTPGISNNLAASAIAGFFASAFSLPFDLVKTKLQKQRPDEFGKLQYKGAVDCAIKTFKTDGILGFYKGFPTFYTRIAPHVMLTLVMMDALKSWDQKQSSK